MDLDYKEYKDYKEQKKKDELRIAAYVTLANGKDIELIRLNKELDKAGERIAELEGRVSELEPLIERTKYLERRARPVILIEKSIFGRALKKFIRLFRHQSSNEEPA